jgi:hypothetical protein
MKWMRIGEDSSAHGRHRHESYQVCRQLRVAALNGLGRTAEAKATMQTATEHNMIANGILAADPISPISLTVCRT